ncbi:MAG: DUF885 domain-containing protein [Bacteroidota bacterium]|nr:DUF885 domain-containing protein [Bacteroidota bacterium]
MTRLLLVALLSISVCACKQEDPNAKFDSFKESFIEQFWEVNPGWASSVGYHRYDSVLTIPDQASNNKNLAFASEKLAALSEFDLTALSDNNKTDYYLIKNQLEGMQWYLNEERSWEWNPSQYNVSGLFADMLVNDYDTLDTRLRNFKSRLGSVPGYYAAARENIKNPTKEHTKLAIDQNLGGVSVFEDDLSAALEKSHLDETEKSEITQLAARAVEAIHGYAEWLRALQNENPRSFRLGKELYPAKFAFEIQSAYSVDEIYDKAVSRKEMLHQKMAALATELWPKYMGEAPKPADSLAMVKQLIDRISLTHVSPDSFQTAIEKQIPELAAFVTKKDLLFIDPARPLVVRKEPAYMAGVAGASISAPGPYDKKGNTYYNVGSLAGWEPDRAESYLREYNHYVLQVLNMHEAIPGHYAQLVYSNQSPSIIKSVFGNGAMVEGWAVYTELMMLENGYGNNQPELWLMYYKWNLRTVCNTILDISVHTKGMTEEEALDLLINEAFQQEAEARGKWTRVQVSSVQLCSYFTGFAEIYDLREELKAKLGDDFDLRSFHEKFLSYGSAPVKYIRTLMLSESRDGSDAK